MEFPQAAAERPVHGFRKAQAVLAPVGLKPRHDGGPFRYPTVTSSPTARAATLASSPRAHSSIRSIGS